MTLMVKVIVTNIIIICFFSVWFNSIRKAVNPGMETPFMRVVAACFLASVAALPVNIIILIWTW